MSAPRVYLHIGAPKTGTTYIQDRLALNQRTLARNGIHFPSRNSVTSPAISQFRAALDLLDQDWGGPPGHAGGGWDAIVRRTKRLSGTVVISHEILAPAKPAQVARAKSSFTEMGAEVHIVYSARDQARQLPAAWQESIKQGRKWPYWHFLKRATSKKSWFARAFDLPEVLTAWGAGLPPERIHVVTVPHVRGPALWDRFADVLGIDSAWVPRESTRVNASLGIAEVQVLRKLNGRLGRSTRKERAYDDLIREMLDDGRFVPTRSAPITLPPRYLPWAQEQSERWIDWIAGSGVDLVGDLDDLRPAPPTDATPSFASPDKVKSKVQLRAALDALAAMTEEAARRNAPEGAVTARVRARVRGVREE